MKIFKVVMAHRDTGTETIRFIPAESEEIARGTAGDRYAYHYDFISIERLIKTE